MDPDAVDQFVSVTGSNPDTATFFIESSKNDVAAAIDQYFSAGGQLQVEESVPAAARQPAAAGASAITPATTGPKQSAPAVAKPKTGPAKGDQTCTWLAPTNGHAACLRSQRVCCIDRLLCKMCITLHRHSQEVFRWSTRFR